MVTAKQVYDMALVLIDEVTEAGEIVPDTPKYYESRAKTILTQLQTELLPASQEPEVITDLTQSLKVADRIAITVLPYGLAAHLLLTEDINTASYFNARYDELKRKTLTAIEPITDVLDVLGGMQ
ncbi:hypothetical protein [Bacillus sp. NTK034]|uniref:hypothetical protein n=1 Tax=Bacillus sp. NTK034 TaxID=2802176 RepID=UPI001A8F10BD|nr:hypothetical protein [Bacillus sp. NTK034]MBN8200481.1 hypothetical protein [Bacillus sp. NTK034]